MLIDELIAMSERNPWLPISVAPGAQTMGTLGQLYQR
jgi:hypothetical protein